MDKKSLGSWGEEAAAEYLRRKGFDIVSKNYSCRFGEIDVIARNDKFVVFVEVKLRKNGDFAKARESVTRRKQERIIATASLWLSKNLTALQPRFDVIEIYAPMGDKTERPEIIHLEDAFQ